MPLTQAKELYEAIVLLNNAEYHGKEKVSEVKSDNKFINRSDVQEVADLLDELCERFEKIVEKRQVVTALEKGQCKEKLFK